MLAKLVSLFNSRKIAVWLLLILVVALVLSTLLPGPQTTTSGEWANLAAEKPLLHWLGTHFATPVLAASPFFIFVSLFLFLSTLVCTVQRLLGWLRSRTSEFSTEKAFSFTLEGAMPCALEAAGEVVVSLLRNRSWDVVSTVNSDGGISFSAQRGIRLGFWGSIIFHGGLLICFLGSMVTALTSYHDQMVVTEGVTLPLHEAVDGARTGKKSPLPAAEVSVEQLRGVYAEGKYKVAFGGVLHVGREGKSWDLPFGVNQPAIFDGFQFSLQQFGFSPRLVITAQQRVVFDYYANLQHPDEGDYFPLDDDGSRLFVVLFPDFYQEGSQIGSRSRELRNPKILFKVVRGNSTVAKGLAGPGEEVRIGEYTVHFSDLKSWVNLSVSRERGLLILSFGFLAGIAGLLVRFLSNERQLTIDLSGDSAATSFRIRGFSRYYPAFLEREVSGIAALLSENGTMKG